MKTAKKNILWISLAFVLALVIVPIAYAAWSAQTIDSTGDVGEYTSLAEVGGQPAISYSASTNGLKYTRYLGGADTGNCGPGGNTWQCDTVDSTGAEIADTSLAEVSGQPAISYYDITNYDLKYARYLGGATSGNCGPGGNTWQCDTIDSAGHVGRSNSLIEISGQPAISYYAFNNGLKYAYYLGGATSGNCGPDGNTWQCDTIDGTSGMGQDTSLAEVGGQPAIGYYDSANSNLKYARYLSGATSGNCGPGGNTWQCDTVDSTGSVGFAPSLAEVSGQPAISYFDNTSDDLKYAHYLGGATSGNCGPGGNTWQCDTVENLGDMGRYNSLAVVSEEPAISYFDNTSSDLKYARYQGGDTSGNCGPGGNTWLCGTVDSTGNVGQYTSLAVINGFPAISYFDNTNNDLKYIQSDTPTAIELQNLTARSEKNLGYLAALPLALMVGIIAVVVRQKKKQGHKQSRN